MKLILGVILLVTCNVISCKTKEVVESKSCVESRTGVNNPRKMLNSEKYQTLLDVSGLYSNIKDWSPFHNQIEEGLTIWVIVKPKSICYRIDIPMDEAGKCQISRFWPEVRSTKSIVKSDILNEVKIFENILESPLEFKKTIKEDFELFSSMRADFILQKIHNGKYTWAVRPDCNLYALKEGSPNHIQLDSVRLFEALDHLIKLSELPALELSEY